MARQPDRDERLLVPACSGERGERVYVRELAQYLHHRSGVLMKFARQRGILHWASRGACFPPVPWVTVDGAKRLIAFVRTLQGAKYHSGIDFHRHQEMMAAAQLRCQARKRARAEAEQNALNTRAHLCIAFPRADTEDESRGGRPDR